MDNTGFIYMVYAGDNLASIFHHGIRTTGNNGDLIAHASGRSCDAPVQDQGSRYLQGTAHQYVAHGDARRQSTLHPEQAYSVLTLRSTPEWYSLTTSLQRIRNESLPDSRFDMLIDFIGERSAWITDTNIRANDILSAVVYENGVMAFPVLNSFVDPEGISFINQSPYIPVGDQGNPDDFEEVSVVDWVVPAPQCAFQCRNRPIGLLMGTGRSLNDAVVHQGGACRAHPTNMRMRIEYAWGRIMAPGLLTIGLM
ncbi:MAG: hypothetical protein JHC61_00845 [Burkholderiaceae bacterium]|nr:hypothetical protein [Burkholderiaceae bacterium]